MTRRGGEARARESRARGACARRDGFSCARDALLQEVAVLLLVVLHQDAGAEELLRPALLHGVHLRREARSAPKAARRPRRGEARAPPSAAQERPRGSKSPAPLAHASAAPCGGTTRAHKGLRWRAPPKAFPAPRTEASRLEAALPPEQPRAAAPRSRTLMKPPARAATAARRAVRRAGRATMAWPVTAAEKDRADAILTCGARTRQQLPACATPAQRTGAATPEIARAEVAMSVDVRNVRDVCAGALHRSLRQHRGAACTARRHARLGGCW